MHAKLLTGGLLPLCATVASDTIYDAFLSDEKKDALLHGHSYTAHAVGCQVAEKSIEIMRDLESGSGWEEYRNDWVAPGRTDKQKEGVWSSWSKGFVEKVSFAEEVESVFAIGTVLAVSLHDGDKAGYSSTAAASLQSKLLTSQDESKSIHSRVLGNVIYFMAAPTSRRQDLQRIERVLLGALA